MQNNPTPSGSMIESSRQTQFAPSAPGATPYNTGTQLTSNGGGAVPGAQPAPKKSHNTLIETMLLVVTSLVAVVFVWLYIQKYIEWDAISTDFDGRVSAQVAVEVAENTLQLEAEFAEREKYPYKSFMGPADYGSFSFEYPQTWSVYIAKDAATGGNFEAYLNPGEVGPLTNSAVVALRMWILTNSFDNVIQSYTKAVSEGTMALKNQEVGGVLANIYTGQNSSFGGAVMVLKLRDKSVVLQTDAEIFLDEFYRILESVKLVE